MNLSELRRRLPSTRQSFSPATSVRLVVQVTLSHLPHCNKFLFPSKSLPTSHRCLRCR